MNEEPMRVLHVIGKMDRGGAEVMVMELYRHIDRNRVQFDFMVHTEEKGAFDDEIEALGGRLHRMIAYRGTNHFEYRRCWHAFFETHPHTYKLVHAHLTTTAAIYFPIAQKYNLKTIAHAHNDTPFYRGIGPFIKSIMREPIRDIADYFLACSPRAGFRIAGDKFMSNARCKVFENAFHVRDFAYDAKTRDRVRKELKLEGKYVVGHVGRFSKVKNHRFLIGVFHQIYKVEKKAVLLLVGDGREKEKIQKKVARLGLQDVVIFLGVREDVAQLLQAMDVFVFPSFYEGLPLSLVEAQIAGLPCVVSKRITDSANLTPLAEHLSLLAGKRGWKDVALSLLTWPDERRDYSERIGNFGYDVTETAEWLPKYYKDCLPYNFFEERR